MNKVLMILLTVLLVAIIFVAFYFGVTPSGKAAWNSWLHAVQKADEETNYKTLKKVEDTCRSMIASYESDVLTYKQYKDADSAEKHGWAEQAKMRANKTAFSYNNFILKNSYVWKSNVPDDIYNELPYIE